ncbi:MAG: YmdB family metallophosphoesterase [Myxococcales bacterium]|nr:YmdB family metallophosphoesterase [Myxococcales bacterium]
MRVLAIGDVIGKPGRAALKRLLPSLVQDERIDVVVANAENAAGGLGTTAETAEDLLAAGVHVLTGGNHTWKHRDFPGYMERTPRVLRPRNYPTGTPGRGMGVFALPDGQEYAVINLIGRVYMDPGSDNPFLAADAAVAELAGRTRVVLVDMHAEASSEKRAMGWHLDGRVSAVWGSHTHVPTADEEILPGGTGYVTDLGMTGPYASVIGLDPAGSVRKFVTGLPSPYRLAVGNIQVRALLIDVDAESGRATEVRRIALRLSE